MWRFGLGALILAISGAWHSAYAAPMATYAQWKTLSDTDAPGFRFAQGEAFLRNHPGWPEEKTLRLRTEAAAMQERPSRAVMQKFCKDFSPISGRGMIACLRVGAADAKSQDDLVRQAWIQGDFSASEETTLLREFGSTLRSADHIKRMDRLLFERRLVPAKRMAALVPRDRTALYEARIALITNASYAPRKVFAVPVNQQRDAGLLFDRIQWRLRNDQEDQIGELFAAAPEPVPYPELWWPARAIAVRQALAARQFTQALFLVDHHGDLKGEPLADALWLKGWMLLEHRKNSPAAYKEFYKLYTNVGTPVSKARAAYWASLAAARNGNADIARQWLTKAAKHPTVFYGQLAHLALTPDAPLKLPANPRYSAAEKEAFAREELVVVAQALAGQNDTKMRDVFLTHLANIATTPTRFALIADLARSVGDKADGVRIAKLALRKGVVLTDIGWPRISLPDSIAIEAPLALAITRQESEFDPLAQSPAKARGLMQLLPSTAKQTAKKHDIGYKNAESLDNPTTNIRLGTAYLGQVIDGFDGSYILGIASYNAGPGNVRKWIRAQGNPPKNLGGVINWMESIPFNETRNYVQRVLENVQVYRALAAPAAPPKLDKDLVR